MIPWRVRKHIVRGISKIRFYHFVHLPANFTETSVYRCNCRPPTEDHWRPSYTLSAILDEETWCHSSTNQWWLSHWIQNTKCSVTMWEGKTNWRNRGSFSGTTRRSLEYVLNKTRLVCWVPCFGVTGAGCCNGSCKKEFEVCVDWIWKWTRWHAWHVLHKTWN